jgi:MerR family transcriptional regulator, heat shock protein HspR
VTGPAADQPVYGISVAAELAGVEPRSLRHYERRGLIHPARTSGGTRRYSNDDVARGRRITALLDGGLNLAGTAMVLDLEVQLAVLRAILARIHRDHPEINTDPDPAPDSSPEPLRESSCESPVGPSGSLSS